MSVSCVLLDSGRILNYPGPSCPNIIVIYEKPYYHDYVRMPYTNEYNHSVRCKCKGK